MPQMSPMSWILISISFLVLTSMFMAFSNSSKIMKSTSLKNKNILWKW